MTITFKNVYIKETSTIAGIYEANGPLRSEFDKTYTKDLYFGESSWEKAEIKLLYDSISLLLKKSKQKETDIDLLISGDLQNQIASSDYASRKFNIPFLGIYNACATSSEGMIIGATFIDSKKIKNCIVATVSHNTSAEKQYRNPTEYGAPKPDTATFTVTGGASILLTQEKTDIKIDNVQNELIFTYYNKNSWNNFKVIPFSNENIAKYLPNYKSVYETYKKVVQKLDENMVVVPAYE